MRIHEPGEGGTGFMVRPGDRPVIPKSWMKLSLDPRTSKGRFYRPGIEWYAELINLEDLPSKKKDEIEREIDRVREHSDEILSSSSLLAGLDLRNPDNVQRVLQILHSNKSTAEWWAYLVGVFLSVVRDAISRGDVPEAVWAMACAERCRSMLVFKEHLEEVIWMGQSAKRIIDILEIWDGNQTNANENFWQKTFRENAYALSQVFATPLVFIRDAAYVGGTNIEGRDGKIVDFLFSVETSHQAVLVEIKTPVTKLLGRSYRGAYRPSPDLTGAVMQVLDYRQSLGRKYRDLLERTDHKISEFAPECVVVVGNGAVELSDAKKRRSFELFRSNSKDVKIVTYDELFRKVEVLANLFGLKKKAS